MEDLEQDALINEEEEKRIRNYIYAGIGIIAVFVFLLIWAIISALFPGEKQPENIDKPISINEENIPLPVQKLENPKQVQNPDKVYLNEKDLRQLNAPQFPEASSLELSQKPAIRQKN